MLVGGGNKKVRVSARDLHHYGEFEILVVWVLGIDVDGVLFAEKLDVYLVDFA